MLRAPSALHSPQMAQEVPIRGDTIRLGQLLKLAGRGDSGSEVKALLASEPAWVNGERETRAAASCTAATACGSASTTCCSSPRARLASGVIVRRSARSRGYGRGSRHILHMLGPRGRLISSRTRKPWRA